MLRLTMNRTLWASRLRVVPAAVPTKALSGLRGVRWTTLGAIAASAIAILGAPQAADGQTEPSAGWVGYIAVDLGWATSAPEGQTTHRESATYTFDGSLQPGRPAGPVRWDQPTIWEASYLHRIAQGTCGPPEEPIPFVSVTRGEGRGDGNGVVHFIGPDNDGRWYYVVSAGGLAGESFPTTTTATCSESFPGPDQAPFPADSGLDRVTKPLPLGATPQDTVTLSGSVTAHGVSNSVDTATVVWHVSRLPDPPQCSNGRDDDGDGYTDYSGGLESLRDRGCTSNEDDDETDALAKVTIDKKTDPPGDVTAFPFTSTLPGKSSFELRDTDTPVSVWVEPGSYSVTELVPTGWRIDAVLCDTTEGASAIVSGATVAIGVEAGDEVTCTYDNRPLGDTFTVVAASVYLAGLRGPRATAAGADGATVLGTPAALARVTEICFTSTWTAKMERRFPTTLSFFWNGQLGPFEDSRLTLVDRKVERVGLLRWISSEIVQYKDCQATTRLIARPWADSPVLTVSHPGTFVGLSHSFSVEVHIRGGRALVVDVPSSSIASPRPARWFQRSVEVFTNV